MYILVGLTVIGAFLNLVVLRFLTVSSGELDGSSTAGEADLPFPWRVATALSASSLLLQRSTDLLYPRMQTCLNPADSRLCSFACAVAWTSTTAPLSPTVTRQAAIATLSFTVPSPTEWTRPLAASTPCHHKPPPGAWHSVWARTILTAGGNHSDWDLWRLEVEIAFVLFWIFVHTEPIKPSDFLFGGINCLMLSLLWSLSDKM